MNEAAIVEYIRNAFPGADVLDAEGDYFFFHNPYRDRPSDRMFPFATLVISDKHDDASDLNRPGVFRLNVGVSKQTFHSLFGEEPEQGRHDFTALDRVMPHPVYGKMYWVCVLNPGEATFETVKQLLAEAHELFVQKHAKAKAANGTE